VLSRVAYDFFWMGRYVERASCISRLLLIQMNEIPEDTSEFVSASWEGLFKSLRLSNVDQSLISSDDRLGSSNDSKSKASDDFLLADAYTLVDHLTFETYHQGSILNCIECVRERARHNQAVLPKSMWLPINKMYLRMKSLNLQDLWPHKVIDLYQEIMEFSVLFYGLVEDSFYQNESVHLIQMGRYTERFQIQVSIFEHHIHILFGHKEEELDLIGLLIRCGAFDNYRQIHSLDLTLPKVIHFLLYSLQFTGSLKFCNDQIKKSLASIEPKNRSNESIYQALVDIDKKLQTTHPEGTPLKLFLSQLYQDSCVVNDKLNQVYFSLNCVEDALKSHKTSVYSNQQ